MSPDIWKTLQRIAGELESLTGEVRADTAAIVRTDDHVEIIKQFDSLRKAVDRIKICREAIADLADELSTKTIPDVVLRLRERTGEKPPFNIEGVGRVSVAYRFSASIMDGKKPEAFTWLHDNGHGGLIQETVNASTLSAFAKDMIEKQGKELPGDMFKTGTMPYVSITKK
jgi:hypothetical protein